MTTKYSHPAEVYVDVLTKRENLSVKPQAVAGANEALSVRRLAKQCGHNPALNPYSPYTLIPLIPLYPFNIFP